MIYTLSKTSIRCSCVFSLNPPLPPSNSIPPSPNPNLILVHYKLYSTTTPLNKKPINEYSPLLKNKKKRDFVDNIVRVDHAGEFGAIRIYDGQLAVLKNTEYAPKIQEMRDKEQEHLDQFNKLIIERRVRPSFLSPIWSAGAYAMGFTTALLGKEAAMACTEAVEDVISNHYNDQLRDILENNPDDEELKLIVKQFRDDEQEHQDTAIAHNSKQAPMYNVIYPTIKFITETAVKVATKL